MIFLFPKKARATNLVYRLRGKSQKGGEGEILKVGWKQLNDRVISWRARAGLRAQVDRLAQDSTGQTSPRKWEGCWEDGWGGR